MSRELDVKVAQALGGVTCSGWGEEWVHVDGSHQICQQHNHCVARIPDFSSEIDAAWYLVAHLRDKWTEATDVPWDAPNLPGSFRSFEAPFDDGAFFEVLHRNADRRWPWAFLYVTPEAICEAFLAVVGVAGSGAGGSNE